MQTYINKDDLLNVIDVLIDIERDKQAHFTIKELSTDKLISTAKEVAYFNAKVAAHNIPILIL
jgi:hypothetical protein